MHENVKKVITESYAGTFRVIITYPAVIRLEEEEENETEICNDDLNMEEDDDYIAVIDSTNCELVFDKEHLDVLSQLKNGKKRKLQNIHSDSYNVSTKMTKY